MAANVRHVALGTPEEQRLLIRRLYRNMGRYVLDTLRTGTKLPPHRIVGAKWIEEVRANGAIIILAHFGNFEMLAPLFGSVLDDLQVIVKPQHNPYVERWLERKRHATGVRTIYQKNAAKKALSAIRNGGAIAALIDQFPGSDGAEAMFMGRPALTVRAIAGLSEHTGALVVSVYARLADDGVYDVVIERVEGSTSNRDKNERILELQTRHNRVVEEWVRAHPEHWFGWFHRRFRPYLDYSR